MLFWTRLRNCEKSVTSSNKPCVVTALPEPASDVPFPVQLNDFCTSLASHSSSHEKPYEYLLKTWETSAVGFLHREMNSSFSSAVYQHQTSIPSLGGPYRSPPSFHSPSANPLFCSFQCKSCYSLQIIPPLMMH